MVKKRLLLFFAKDTISTPIVHDLIKEFDLLINIFRAKITPEEEGYLAIDLKGEEESIKKAVIHMTKNGVQVNENFKGVQWEKDHCTACGNCIPHCPTKALYIKDVVTQEVDFDGGLCIGCLSCIANCPFGACSSIF